MYSIWMSEWSTELWHKQNQSINRYLYGDIVALLNCFAVYVAIVVAIRLCCCFFPFPAHFIVIFIHIECRLTQSNSIIIFSFFFFDLIVSIFFISICLIHRWLLLLLLFEWQSQTIRSIRSGFPVCENTWSVYFYGHCLFNILIRCFRAHVCMWPFHLYAHFIFIIILFSFPFLLKFVLACEYVLVFVSFQFERKPQNINAQCSRQTMQ